MPAVSVVIPTYNRAAYLRQAVESVLAQGDEMEIIVVDDGSTDETPQVVRSFGARVTLLSAPHSGLPAVARNRGVGVARGELLAFLDSDDLFLPGKLALQSYALRENPTAGLAYSNGSFFRTDPGQAIGNVLDGMPTPSGDAFAELLRGNFLFPATVLVRRTCVVEAGGFDEDPGLAGVEDYDLWLRIAARADFVHAPGRVAAIRRHSGCLSRDPVFIRSGVLRVLRKIERRLPERARAARAALHEGRARSHASIAVEMLRRSRPGAGMLNVVQALGQALYTPYAGVPAFVAWWQRRYKRRGARP